MYINTSYFGKFQQHSHLIVNIVFWFNLIIGRIDAFHFLIEGRVKNYLFRLCCFNFEALLICLFFSDKVFKFHRLSFPISIKYGWCIFFKVSSPHVSGYFWYFASYDLIIVSMLRLNVFFGNFSPRIQKHSTFLLNFYKLI